MILEIKDFIDLCTEHRNGYFLKAFISDYWICFERGNLITIRNNKIDFILELLNNNRFSIYSEYPKFNEIKLELSKLNGDNIYFMKPSCY